MHVFLQFGTFGIEVLQLILASKLSEVEQFENWAENYQIASKCVKMRPKSKTCHFQALENESLGGVMVYMQ